MRREDRDERRGEERRGEERGVWKRREKREDGVALPHSLFSGVVHGDAGKGTTTDSLWESWGLLTTPPPDVRHSRFRLR